MLSPAQPGLRTPHRLAPCRLPHPVFGPYRVVRVMYVIPPYTPDAPPPIACPRACAAVRTHRLSTTPLDATHPAVPLACTTLVRPVPPSHAARPHVLKDPLLHIHRLFTSPLDATPPAVPLACASLLHPVSPSQAARSSPSPFASPVYALFLPTYPLRFRSRASMPPPLSRAAHLHIPDHDLTLLDFKTL